jgi:hypothetical protein
MMTRRLLLEALLRSLTRPPETVTVILHLRPGLVERCRIAQHSRNNLSLEDWITETIAGAVSDCSVEPGGCHGLP